MKIYVRKILNHDITHEVSVTTSIVREFFDGKTSFYMIGKKSNEKGVITINSATDPRFGGDFKQLLRKEGDVSEGDIVLIYKYQNHYVVDIITKQDAKYESIMELCKEDKRHTLLYGEKELVIDSDNESIIVEDLSEKELGRKLKEYYDSDVSDKVTGIYLFGIKYGKLISQKNYNKKNIINYSGINESYYAELNKAINISEFAKILNGNEKYIVQEFNERERIQGAYNMIYYGTPGCGKSYKVNKDFSENDFLVYRTTFHPEYSNSDFVGQIIPKTENGEIKYEFQEGPFTLALCEAMENPSKRVCLIIEEINRGNASAIFGDIFQLLDREKDGSSVYDINNEPIKNYLNKNGVNVDKIKIPSNMWIIATMNTSDQNVFTLDTAFKRRWRMHRIINEFNKEEAYDNKLASMYIPGSSYTWEQFIITINNAIMDKNPTGLNSEDKQLGVYFVTENELSAIPVNDDKEAMDRFIEKVLLYIWDDVAKLDTTLWFDHNINSFDELVKSYYDNKLHIFKDMFKDQNNESQVEEINERN